MTSPRLLRQSYTVNNGFAARAFLANNPDGLALPAATITVTSTDGFTDSGQIGIYAANGQDWTLQTITYTSKNATQFLGCTGGIGTLYNNNAYPNATVVTQTTTSAVLTGNWVCPPGVKWVWVTGCGGGGGGGSGASVSSTNNAYPLFVWCIAGGGGGGQAAITSTHVVPVTPGVSYPISIGLGGLGAMQNAVWNGAPYIVQDLYPNNYGGACWGNVGNNGQSSIFGSVIFPGGQGGRRGEILQRVTTVNQFGTYSGGDNPVGSTQYNKTAPGYSPTPFQNPVLGGNTVLGRTYGIWNPPGLTSSQYVLDQVMTIGLINSCSDLVGPSAVAGAGNLWTPGRGGSGGGGGGGISNNVYSAGGAGGDGAGANGHNFSYAGNYGIYGGGGGGGGGGEGINYNNTHDGAYGGNGGAGFIEIAWLQ